MLKLKTKCGVKPLRTEIWGPIQTKSKSNDLSIKTINDIGIQIQLLIILDCFTNKHDQEDDIMTVRHHVNMSV